MGLIISKPSDLSTKTNEQKKVINEYFFATSGCGKSCMTDEAYKALVKAKKDNLQIKKKALQKLGIDEDEVTEIAPVEFEGYSFDGDYMSLNGYSSKYEVTWLFFSHTQIFMYSYTFDMVSDSKKERTEEYFYKDVTNFSSTTESVEFIVSEKRGGCGGGVSNKKGSLDTSKFAIVVPGDKFMCAMQKTEEIENRIQGMKQKLREKKNIQ